MNNRKEIKQICEKTHTKSIVDKAKKNGLIKSLKEAFKKTPAISEAHKGDASYFLD